MKAAFITQTGPPSVIRYDEIDTPTPGDGQVLVRMSAVAVNPIDTYIRSGLVDLPLPDRYIIGSDVAGTIEAVGNGVQELHPGDRVWASNQGLSGRQGTFSEFVVIDQDWVYRTPDNVSDETAAAVALVGITAHLGLHLHAGLKEGEVVFVNGGTGGVGSSVVQLASAAGARVITTVGSDEKQVLACELGADVAINYRTEDVQQSITAATSKMGLINVWFETLRNASPETTFPHLAKRGRYVLMAGRDARPVFPVGPFYVNDLRAVGFAMFNADANEQRASAQDLNRLMSDGRLKALIGARFKLCDAAAAHELQEQNTLQGTGTLSGKIVLTQ